MAAASLLKAYYLTHLSKPSSDRLLYRLIQKHKIQRILELGIGTTQRAVRMIELAQRVSPQRRISYTGIDPFESRGSADGPGVTLKLAYQRLGATGARIQLIPGDPFSALARTANGLMGTDLVVISASQDRLSVERAWFYLPRVIRPGAHVLREAALPGGETVMRAIAASELARLAHERSRRRAA